MMANATSDYGDNVSSYNRTEPYYYMYYGGMISDMANNGNMEGDNVGDNDMAKGNDDKAMKDGDMGDTNINNGNEIGAPKLGDDEEKHAEDNRWWMVIPLAIAGIGLFGWWMMPILKKKMKKV
ncbi:hypothetical protein IJ096_01300 [Candidatus Saccharibacteria bacterium]|nr:hypothetical protein [Candidatus Saccharibacteria bacterium]